MAERLAASGFAAKADAGYADSDDHANLGPRVVAYLVDTVVLFAFTMLFATISFLNILLSTGSGYDNVSDRALWISVTVLMLTLPAWVAVNLFLVSKRQYTVGHYIMGLRVAGEDGSTPSFKRLLVNWLALHPLVFHPVLAIPWLLFAYVSFSLAQNVVMLVLMGAIGILCIVTPIAGLIFAASDPQRRAIHDRIAATKVVRVD